MVSLATHCKVDKKPTNSGKEARAGVRAFSSTCFLARSSFVHSTGPPSCYFYPCTMVLLLSGGPAMMPLGECLATPQGVATHKLGTCAAQWRPSVEFVPSWSHNCEYFIFVPSLLASLHGCKTQIGNKTEDTSGFMFKSTFHWTCDSWLLVMIAK